MYSSFTTVNRSARKSSWVDVYSTCSKRTVCVCVHVGHPCLHGGWGGEGGGGGHHQLWDMHVVNKLEA